MSGTNIDNYPAVEKAGRAPPRYAERGSTGSDTFFNTRLSKTGRVETAARYYLQYIYDAAGKFTMLLPLHR